MTTTTTHISNFGRFSGRLTPNTQGYVIYHDSPRYASASDAQLDEWADNGRTAAIRNAARIEQSERAIAGWRAGH